MHDKQPIAVFVLMILALLCGLWMIQRTPDQEAAAIAKADPPATLAFSSQSSNVGVYVSNREVRFVGLDDEAVRWQFPTHICFPEGCIEIETLRRQLRYQAWTPGSDGSCRVTDRPQ